jgi:hypothetical protein
MGNGTFPLKLSEIVHIIVYIIFATTFDNKDASRWQKLITPTLHSCEKSNQIARTTIGEEGEVNLQIETAGRRGDVRQESFQVSFLDALPRLNLLFPRRERVNDVPASRHLLGTI